MAVRVALADAAQLPEVLDDLLPAAPDLIYANFAPFAQITATNRYDDWLPSLNVVWDKAIAAGRAFGMRMEGIWMHVGSADALVQAERQLARAAVG